MNERKEPKRELFEAIIKRSRPGAFGEMVEHIDPVLTVSISNGLHTYEYSPDELDSVTFAILRVERKDDE